MNERGALGRYGEDLAARRLREHGMTILERNWRCAEGEIDIVARHRDALVICEVKTRRAARVNRATQENPTARPGAQPPTREPRQEPGGASQTPRTKPYEHPISGVRPAKAARLRRLAARWLSERWLRRYGQPPAGGVRIDLVGVLLPERGAPLVEHTQGVA